MINIGLSNIDNQWHVLNRMEYALMCRIFMTPEFYLGWDHNGDIIDDKDIEELHEGICIDCVKACFKADQQQAEYEAQKAMERMIKEEK